MTPEEGAEATHEAGVVPRGWRGGGSWGCEVGGEAARAARRKKYLRADPPPTIYHASISAPRTHARDLAMAAPKL